ncbi:MAG: hypothetical protein WBN06_11805 [Lysobacterales bacterium]|jgi:hypothetical protein
MSNNQLLRGLAICLLCVCSGTQADTFITNDIFGLEYASDPQISADGKRGPQLG